MIHEVEVRYADGSMEVDQPQLDVSASGHAANDRIRFKLEAPAGDSRRVTIIGRGADGGWLTGKARKSGTGAIMCDLPNTVTVGTEYKYDVDIDGVGTLDPRVKVVP